MIRETAFSSTQRLFRGLSPAAVAVGAALWLSACFFDELQRSEESDIQRVQDKQSLLRTEQNKAATIRQQEEQLANELSEREFSLSQLNDRVQRINGENGRAMADNDEARLRHDDMLGRLHETNEALASAQQSGAGSIEERRERITILRARLKAELDQLLR